MPSIYVCPLSRIDEIVDETGARSLVTLLSPGTGIVRPGPITTERHLNLGISDIVAAAPGQVLPEAEHIETLIGFFRKWDREQPMLVHCFAGVSRSTASAFIAVCAIAPHRNEAEVARALRAASPTATPNARFVALADHALGRGGRMVAAIEAIGRGEDCTEGRPFRLDP